MDKHGIQEGEAAPGIVIGDALTPRALVKSSDDTTWVSIMETVTADGRRPTLVGADISRNYTATQYFNFGQNHQS